VLTVSVRPCYVMLRSAALSRVHDALTQFHLLPYRTVPPAGAATLEPAAAAAAADTVQHLSPSR